MDFYPFALSDWEVYHDTERIRVFVQLGKITDQQYETITKEPY
ncbi:XkdX family protein [Bacillus sp. V3B]|nr:XkdX family protein [Bacillus sp. V3B]MCQ6275749.1 XkdX family protein [Bacillus sp. V3B]